MKSEAIMGVCRTHSFTNGGTTTPLTFSATNGMHTASVGGTVNLTVTAPDSFSYVSWYVYPPSAVNEGIKTFIEGDDSYSTEASVSYTVPLTTGKYIFVAVAQHLNGSWEARHTVTVTRP